MNLEPEVVQIWVSSSDAADNDRWWDERAGQPNLLAEASKREMQLHQKI